MGFMEELKRLARPYEDDEEDLDDFAPVEKSERGDRAERKEKTRDQTLTSFASPSADAHRSEKVVSIHTTTRLQVVLAKPERFEDATAIADHLHEKRTVVLNLEKANKELARRLLDFISGATYAQDGNIKKVAISTYIITPCNVDIMGDLVSELENNGLYGE
ncbi:MAG: cell division protein SepF [Oscillospiraceae bacterium]